MGTVKIRFSNGKTLEEHGVKRIIDNVFGSSFRIEFLDGTDLIIASNKIDYLRVGSSVITAWRKKNKGESNERS